MKVLFLVLLFILGGCFGSFLCCQARRLHLKEKENTSNSAKAKSSKLGHRSICLHCGYQLKWYDNIPIVSWLFLRGKCRKCHHKIGIAEILSELGVALAFLGLSTTFDPFSSNILSWIIFITLLIFTLVLSFLAIYDGLYGELPLAGLILAIVLAIVVLSFRIISSLFLVTFTPDLIWRPLVSVLILGGLYLILYLISKGKWVGDGDWILGVALGLTLFEPWLALLTLFLANFIACVVMLPSLRKHHKHTIYFGPFLVVAFALVITFAEPLCSLVSPYCIFALPVL